MNVPLISVILATRNEEKNIERCLKSILDQVYPRDSVEIIVVDNNSTDKTRTLATQYTDKVFNLKDLIDLKSVKNFRGAQLNAGFARSKGEIIFLPDTDMTFDSELFEEVSRFIVQEKYDGLYIPETIIGKGFFGKIRNFERSFYNMTSIDGIRVVTRKLYTEIHGFDEKNIMFGPDDWDFTKMIKNHTDKVTITTSRLYHHEESLSLRTYLSKKSKYIDTFADYKKKWGANDPDIRKQFSLYYRFFGVFVEQGKWKQLCAHPIIAMGMYGLRFLVGIQYLIKP